MYEKQAASFLLLTIGLQLPLIMSEEKAKNFKFKTVSKLFSFCSAAQEPECVSTAPAKALPKALSKANISIDKVDFLNWNEAFSELFSDMKLRLRIKT